MLSKWYGEFEWDNFTVKFHSHRGQKTGVVIEYGKNLTAMEQDEDNSGVYTALLPYAVYTPEGSDTETVVTLPEVTLPIVTSEIVRAKTLIMDFSDQFDGVVTEDALRAKANSYIKANPLGATIPTVKVSFEPLWKQPEYSALLERVNLCDTVTIRHSLLGVSVSAIRNEKYCGDCLFQKAFIANPITHQQVRNNGELPKYLVEDCLPAIVDKETWKLAQAVAARHTPHKQASNERYPFTGKLFCGVCGKPYCYYHYTTTNKQPLAAYRCMSRKTQSAVEVPGQTYTPPHKATFNLNASPELIAYRERYCKPPKERPMLCTDVRISIDLPQKAFCRAWNLIVAKKLRYQATLRSTVDNAEDILVRYRSEEMCLLIDEIGKLTEFSYPLMLKTLDRVVVNTNGKLTFIFQSGIKITV